MRTLLAAVLGGAVIFVWGWVSWTVLPWHTPTLKAFANEDAVAQVLANNASASAVYLIPDPRHMDGDAAAAQSAPPGGATPTPAPEKPFAFVAFTRAGMEAGMNLQLACALALQIVVALLIVLLLAATEGLDYLSRVLFVTVVGVIIALAGHGPNWIWWRFATDFTLVNCADAVIGWLLAGFAIAAFTGEERPRLGGTMRRARL